MVRYAFQNPCHAGAADTLFARDRHGNARRTQRAHDALSRTDLDGLTGRCDHHVETAIFLVRFGIGRTLAEGFRVQQLLRPPGGTCVIHQGVREPGRPADIDVGLPAAFVEHGQQVGFSIRPQVIVVEADPVGKGGLEQTGPERSLVR